ncbi:MAG TPA: extracellular solute-binding protein [candidate division WWE3 bacterium]|uniref:Extracellular solute-binding protein n=1 Tax=candidate division WWE3 bacterium TaxID=2053526 RepID=A0A7C1DI06_UNCKA|nr:extracellular solute-binding protein [candidate division WWE3 bacterium]
MKYKLPTLVLLVSLAFLLTACTLQDLPLIGQYLPGGKPVTSGPVTLTMWGLWENPEVMQALIAEYTSRNTSVTINYEDRSVLKPVSSYKERVFNRIIEADSPDIVRIHSSWVPRMINGDMLAPMPKSVMSVEEFSNAFYPIVSAQAVSGGNAYAMPLYYDGLALVYNRDHFDEVGQQSPPTAWEEFRRLALELSIYSDQDLIRAGAAMGSANNIDFCTDILGLMWSQAGVDIINGLDSRSAQDALTFYINFAKEDKVWNDNFPEATQAFANGQVSMIFVPTWQILDILAASPGLNIGVAPVPQVSAESPTAWGSFWMEGVSAKSQNAAVAWDFLKFLVEKEQQLSFFNSSSNYRGFGSPYARKDLSDELALNDYLRPYVLDAPYAKTAEIAGRSGNSRQEEAIREAINSVLSGISAGEALTKAKAEISR